MFLGVHEILAEGIAPLTLRGLRRRAQAGCGGMRRGVTPRGRLGNILMELVVCGEPRRAATAADQLSILPRRRRRRGPDAHFEERGRIVELLLRYVAAPPGLWRRRSLLPSQCLLASEGRESTPLVETRRELPLKPPSHGEVIRQATQTAPVLRAGVRFPLTFAVSVVVQMRGHVDAHCGVIAVLRISVLEIVLVRTNGGVVVEIIPITPDGSFHVLDGQPAVSLADYLGDGRESSREAADGAAAVITAAMIAIVVACTPKIFFVPMIAVDVEVLSDSGSAIVVRSTLLRADDDWLVGLEGGGGVGSGGAVVATIHGGEGK